MRFCYSKGGWLLILYGKKSILLWNGFSKDFISVPDMLKDCDPFQSNIEFLA
ncbi:hypothetical protein SLEP1_g50903 [Rubroshorea leprosula]|uniref:Photosystem II protein I n=1 Tax=Rubroshorea leprosula TaxID=152421 RepID=A0AAV5M1K3_9ROSI|nr:hypothetical protein SLEP1_g50903 [Rubroshorea leprosula]